MPISEIMELLEGERDKINRAIEALAPGTGTARVQATEGKQIPAVAGKVKGPAGWNQAQRNAHSLRVKQMWAKRRAAAAPKATPTPAVAKVKGPAGWDEKQRKAHSLRMKRQWVKRREEQKLAAAAAAQPPPAPPRKAKTRGAGA